MSLWKSIDQVKSGLKQAENTVESVSCAVQYWHAFRDGCIGMLVFLVASASLAMFTKREPVQGRIESSSDSHVLEDHPGATVSPRQTKTTNSEGKTVYTTVYDVTFENGQTRTCSFRPDLSKGFPVSVRGRTIECQSWLWNTCTMRVEYAGKLYDVSKWSSRSCVPDAGTTSTFYYGSGSLSATNFEAYARTGLQFIRFLSASRVAWELVRVLLLKKMCSYQLKPADLSANTSAELCREFVDAYNQALRLDKLEETYETGEKVASMATSFVGDSKAGRFVSDAVEGTAGIAKGQNAFRFAFRAMEADYRLWRCARGHGDLGTYMATLLGGAVATFAVSSYAGAWAFSKRMPVTEEGETNPYWWVSNVVGAIVGVMALNTAHVVHRGVNRKAVGLSFLDWPRMVL